MMKLSARNQIKGKVTQVIDGRHQGVRRHGRQVTRAAGLDAPASAAGRRRDLPQLRCRTICPSSGFVGATRDHADTARPSRSSSPLQLGRTQGHASRDGRGSHAGHNGARTNRYTGVLLWTLVKDAEPIDENGPRTHLQHTIRATGQDGYAVVLAIGEIEPDFEGKQVLVAYAQDGQALTSLKLIVPADAKAGRSVRDLVAIAVN